MLKMNIKCAFALVLMLCCSFTVAEAAKKKTKAIRPTYGRIEVTSNPAGVPILVNGKQVGVTAADPSGVTPIDLPPGQYKVEVQFKTKTHTQMVDVVAGKRSCICLTYTPRIIKRCVPPGSLTVTGPASMAEGEPVTFTSNVTYEGSSALNYTWTVSPVAARIVKGGPGSDEITVSTEGLGGQAVTAILVVDDGSGDAACRRSAQASVEIIPPEELIRFDLIPDVTNDDLKARLDNFAIELQNTPGAQGYVIIYTGQYLRGGNMFERRSKFIRDYMVNTRNFDTSRLVIKDGGARSTSSYELYVVPQGKKPPEVTPSSYTPSESVSPPSPTERTRRSRRSRRDE
jgi:hypothetical protein